MMGELLGFVFGFAVGWVLNAVGWHQRIVRANSEALAEYRRMRSPLTREQIDAAGEKAMRRYYDENQPCVSCGMRIGHLAQCAARAQAGEDSK